MRSWPWADHPAPYSTPFRLVRVRGGALAVGQATMDTIAGATRDTHATSRGSTPSRRPTLLQKGGTDERDTANRPHRRHGGADHAPVPGAQCAGPADGPAFRRGHGRHP